MADWRPASTLLISARQSSDAARDGNMFEYEYSDDNVRKTSETFAEIVGEVLIDTVDWIFFVALVIATLFGLISWCLLKKFRTFRNYVLLSTIIAQMLLMLMFDPSDLFGEETVKNNEALRIIPFVLLVFFIMCVKCWLIVLCFVFSVDFVRVFHYDFRAKYLCSTLFAWGVPFIIVLIYTIVGCVLINRPSQTDIFDTPTAMILLLIPVAISLVTFIAVICRLFSDSSANNNLCVRFTIAISIFTLSNYCLFTIVTGILDKNIYAVDILGEIIEYVIIIALIVFIVVLKSNWKLWRDYINKRFAPESGVMLHDQRI